MERINKTFLFVFQDILFPFLLKLWGNLSRDLSFNPEHLYTFAFIWFVCFRNKKLFVKLAGILGISTLFICLFWKKVVRVRIDCASRRNSSFKVKDLFS